MSAAVCVLSPPEIGGEPSLPLARGPLSEALLAYLRGAATPADLDGTPAERIGDDDDAQLALYCCYELHYRGFDGVAPELEWDLAVLGLRGRLERQFLAEIADQVDLDRFGPDLDHTRAVESALRTLATTETGPSLSRYLCERGTIEELREFCIHRSAYQLKEADPHTWAIPRLTGQAKATMVEIQADEYGNGRCADMHAELFAGTLGALDLDPSYGAYVERLPGVTLATTNLISLFGLHRRWRGALVGHLALFEMTSVGPMSRYSTAFDRFGLPAPARRFYDTHVEIDAHHEHIALESMVRELVRREPHLGRDVVFGAAALTAVETRFTAHLLGSWRAGRSSLNRAVAGSATGRATGAPRSG